MPRDVTAAQHDGVLIIHGPKGELRVPLPPGWRFVREGAALRLEPLAKKPDSALWGTFRSLVANAIAGVSTGFERKLEIEGIGYQARLEGENLILQIGFTHPVVVRPKPGISFRVERNVIAVGGTDKQLVGQVAAEVRALRKPEPYKGKGIRYQGETIYRKSGKKTVAAA